MVDADPNRASLVSSTSPVSRVERETLLQQRGHVLWFTGLSGAGKTTLACEMERRLLAKGILTARLDGDLLREGLNADLGFSSEDRRENIRRVTALARLMLESGLVILVSAISPYERDRLQAKETIGKSNFSLIYVATSLARCEARDPKGLYQKARAGEITGFTGIDDPYEMPSDPDFTVDTSDSVEASAAHLLAAFDTQNIMTRRKSIV